MKNIGFVSFWSLTSSGENWICVIHTVICRIDPSSLYLLVLLIIQIIGYFGYHKTRLHHLWKSKLLEKWTQTWIENGWADSFQIFFFYLGCLPDYDVCIINLLIIWILCMHSKKKLFVGIFCINFCIQSCLVESQIMWTIIES